jgi:hypothetical protein
LRTWAAACIFVPPQCSTVEPAFKPKSDSIAGAGHTLFMMDPWLFEHFATG